MVRETRAESGVFTERHRVVAEIHAQLSVTGAIGKFLASAATWKALRRDGSCERLLEGNQQHLGGSLQLEGRAT